MRAIARLLEVIDPAGQICERGEPLAHGGAWPGAVGVEAQADASERCGGDRADAIEVAVGTELELDRVRAPAAAAAAGIVLDYRRRPTAAPRGDPGAPTGDRAEQRGERGAALGGELGGERGLDREPRGGHSMGLGRGGPGRIAGKGVGDGGVGDGGFDDRGCGDGGRGDLGERVEPVADLERDAARRAPRAPAPRPRACRATCRGAGAASPHPRAPLAVSHLEDQPARARASRAPRRARRAPSDARRYATATILTTPRRRRRTARRGAGGAARSRRGSG